jgi:tetratricopeptide (TPR) repeat protein
MSRAALLFVGALLALAVALAVACGRSAPPDDAPFDVETMAYLSEARALHHQAGIREDTGDLPGAIGAMTRLTSAARPHPDRKVPEVEEVLADAFARRAELELRAGKTEEAMASVREGLVHAEGPTFFRGHLIEVEGLVEKARAAALTDAGKSDEAKAARERAIRRLDEAVKIQEAVVNASLDGGAR